VADNTSEGPGTLAEAIDVVEEAYEFMLAYAAQGRRGEDDGDIRRRLGRAETALAFMASLTSLTSDRLGGAGKPQAAAGFIEVLKEDAARAASAFRFVLAQPAIGSQMVDNLNVSTHVRTVLTDIFLLDEALKISGI
jgi:hypothetical protein